MSIDQMIANLRLRITEIDRGLSARINDLEKKIEKMDDEIAEYWRNEEYFGED